jgi:hypothetical protein
MNTKTQITDKTFAILYWNEDYDWVDEREAEIIKQALARGDKFFDLGNDRNAMSSVARIISGEKMNSIIRRKNGERQCGDCGRWLPKGYTCGCQGGKF